MRLEEIVPENVTLEELEDLQTQLHQLLVQKYGAGAAAAVRQKDRVVTVVPAEPPPSRTTCNIYEQKILTGLAQGDSRTCLDT